MVRLLPPAPGGGVFFSSVAAGRLGLHVHAITKCCGQHHGLFVEMREAVAQLTMLGADASTSCENNYPSKDPDHRLQRFLSLAPAFTEAELELAGHATVLHINPLWYGEFPEALIPIGMFIDDESTHLTKDEMMLLFSTRIHTHAPQLGDAPSILWQMRKVSSGMSLKRMAA